MVCKLPVFCYTHADQGNVETLFQSYLGTVFVQNQTGVAVLLLTYIDRLNAEYKGTGKGHKLGA